MSATQGSNDAQRNERILDGKAVAAQLRAELAVEAAALKRAGVRPGLAVVLVGENPASVSYVTAKQKACEEVGIVSRLCKMPDTTTETELLDQVRALNADPAVHGILVQLPLPKGVDESAVLRTIDPAKDVDGFHPVNVGKMLLGEDTFLPCTPYGIVELLARSGIATAGAHVVIVGRSHIVGKPLANLLLQKGARGDATVTVCHTGTKDMAVHTRQADILVVAAGRPGIVTAEMVREGAVVIDVGVNRIEDATRKSGFRLAGDVDFEALLPRVARITPVPGGVGPMTIAMLLSNTVKAARAAGGDGLKETA